MIAICRREVAKVRQSHSGRTIPAWLQGVTELGFEPKTHSLEGCCSIQLSYQANSNVIGRHHHHDAFFPTTFRIYECAKVQQFRKISVIVQSKV